MPYIFELGLANALTATVLAGAVWAACRVYRRPALVHSLWLLVLVKLLMPPVIDIPIFRIAPAALPNETSTVGGLTPSIGAAVAWLWIGGSSAVLAVTMLRVLQFRRLIATTAAAPATMRHQARELGARLQLSSIPEIGLVRRTISPLLWSIGSPRIYFPTDLLHQLDDESRLTLLAHEMCHYRRRDHWVRWLELIVTTLYWWHPVVWFARRRIREAEEQCCDAWVLHTLPESAAAYARALLSTVEYLAGERPKLAPAATGVGHVEELRRRLTGIMRTASPRYGAGDGWWAFAGLAVFMLPFVPTRIPAPAPAPTPTPAFSAGTTEAINSTDVASHRSRN